ncbi:hypothetical protein AMATHDRAFT_46409 [Amanita thiersii Skay4041]|uniref:Uncharacterized protein n=1 Tax=Amanita thiersii Skay4041 TaxID=703135 RepID=A0A2A9NVF3_9AGAR|nr:hypothetical protein AMATHDRAFT_46409 [Amanita thiersii Skay4041]
MGYARLIIIIATSLTLAQSILLDQLWGPSLNLGSYTIVPSPQRPLRKKRRERRRPKPKLHIPPSQSNIARADAFALELGLGHPPRSEDDDKTIDWQAHSVESTLLCSHDAGNSFDIEGHYDYSPD